MGGSKETRRGGNEGLISVIWTTVGAKRYDGTDAQKVSGWTAFYRARFHRVGAGWSTARVCGRQHECLMEWAGGSEVLVVSLSLPLFSLSLSSLPIYLSPSRRPILLAITSLVDQIKGLGAAREPTQRGLGKGWGFKVTDRLQEVGGVQNRDSFPRGGWSS